MASAFLRCPYSIVAMRVILMLVYQHLRVQCNFNRCMRMPVCRGLASDAENAQHLCTGCVMGAGATNMRWDPW